MTLTCPPNRDPRFRWDNYPEIFFKKFDQESVSDEFAKAFVKEHQEALNED
jgi:hypothetical protein